MCLGGHLAYRSALDPRVSATVCYFATDLHNHSLGAGKHDDSLARAKEIRGELAMIHGVRDTHVPPEGRDVIRKSLRDAGVVFSWFEVAWAQRMFFFFFFFFSSPLFPSSLLLLGRPTSFP
jgi:carboxymethylenebutenolidase